jgi:hypothetical protein
MMMQNSEGIIPETIKYVYALNFCVRNATTETDMLRLTALNAMQHLPYPLIVLLYGKL